MSEKEIDNNLMKASKIPFSRTYSLRTRYKSPYICTRNHDFPETHFNCKICDADIKQCGICHSGICVSCKRNEKIGICLI